MNHAFKKFAAQLLALLIASAGSAFGASGPDTINGKPLNEVHDIVKEMNGGESVIPKAQLMQLSMGGGGKLVGDLWSAPLDPKRSASEKQTKNVVQLSDFQANNNYMGVQAAVSTRIVSGLKRRVVVGDVDYRKGSGGFQTFLTEPTSGPSTKISGSVRSLPVPKISSSGKYQVLTDLRGGLFIDGEQVESFVAGIIDDDHLGSANAHTFTAFDCGITDASPFAGYRSDQVGVLILDGRKLNDESFKGDPTGGKMIDTFKSDSLFPAVRVVAGDFDGDGIASEIAMIATPKEKTYYVCVRKVSRDASGNVTVKDIGSNRWDIGDIDLGVGRGKQDDYANACDIVAGDFDGDDMTEFAVIAFSNGGDDRLKPLIQTFKYIDGEFRTSQKVFTKEFRDFHESHLVGILAAAGDFDGNGKDEIAFFEAFSNHGQNDAVWYLAAFAFETEKDGAMKGALRPILKTTLDSKGEVPELSLMRIKVGYERGRHYMPLAHVVSLAAGPVYGASGLGGLYDELYLSVLLAENEKESTEKTPSNKLYRVLDPLGTPSLWKGLSPQTGDVRAGLIAADFAGESLVLGDDPTHIITEEASSFTHIVPAVPYHIDYIRSDWDSPQAEPAPRTLQMITQAKTKVTFSKSISESNQTDTSFETTSHFEWNVGLGADIKKPVKKVGLSGGAKGGYQHSSDKIMKSLSSNTSSKVTTIENEALADDIVVGYSGRLHVWRYPIIGTCADDPKLINDVFSDASSDVLPNDPLMNAEIDPKAQKYYTIVRLAEVEDNHIPGDRYQPDHDERNLFSYPNALQYDKSYTTRQEALSSPSNFMTDQKGSHEISFNSESFQTDEELSTESSGGSLSITGGIAIPAGEKSVFTLQPEGGFSTNRSVSNGSTFTSTAKKSTSYKVAAEGDQNNEGALFKVNHAAYVDAGGITTLAFAPDMRASTKFQYAWDASGPYGSAPDPSLVLPGRVTISDGVAKAATHPRNATKLRGVRIYDIDAGEDPEVGTSYTTSTLIKGRRYAIVVPVYNASFVKTDEFMVEVGYTTSEYLDSLMEKGKLPELGDPEVKLLPYKTLELSGWKQKSDAHRGKVRFDWTVPSDLIPSKDKDNAPARHYDFCIRIWRRNGRDGDIHKEWNGDESSPAYDPCGNDWGYFSFAVIDEEDFDSEPPKYVSRKDGKVITAAEKSEPNIELTFHVDGEDPMTLDAFRRWLEGRTEPVDVKVEIKYTGGKVVVGANIVIYELLEDGRKNALINRDLTSLFPGKSVSRYVTVDPQKFLPRSLCVKVFGSNIPTQIYGEPSDDDSSDSPADDVPTDDDEPASRGRSGGGCSSGTAGFAMLGLLAAAALMRRK